jgi:hypothetical protein
MRAFSKINSGSTVMTVLLFSCSGIFRGTEYIESYMKKGIRGFRRFWISGLAPGSGKEAEPELASGS